MTSPSRRDESTPYFSYVLSVNPYATRYVAPGCLEWLTSSEDEKLDRLIRNFACLGSRAQVVGPHGSGKTTLLYHLIPRLGSLRLQMDWNGLPVDQHPLRFSEAGNVNSQYPASLPRRSNENSSRRTEVYWLTLRHGEKTIQRLPGLIETLEKQSLLVLDGFEQLSWYRQWWIKWNTQRRGIGLLVTCHRSVGLPTLFRTNINPPLAKEIAQLAWLQATGQSHCPAWIDEFDYVQFLRSNDGNMRECLMQFYDMVEAKKGE